MHKFCNDHTAQVEFLSKISLTLRRISLAEHSINSASSSNKGFSLPSRIPASMAAPMGITSSGGIEFSNSTFGKMSLISCCSFGIRADPPHRTTWKTCLDFKYFFWQIKQTGHNLKYLKTAAGYFIIGSCWNKNKSWCHLCLTSSTWN